MKLPVFNFQLPIVLLVCALSISCSLEEKLNKSGTRVEAGEAVPLFGINDLTNSHPFDSRTAFPGDRAVMIYLLMTSCPDCRAQTPAVVELWRDCVKPSYDDGSPVLFNLLCIARGDDNNTLARAEEYWREMADELGVARADMPPLYYDSKRNIYNMFAYSGVPRFYAISPAGFITWEALTEDQPLTCAALTDKLHEAYR